MIGSSSSHGMAITYEAENGLQNRTPLCGGGRREKRQTANGNTARCHSITESWQHGSP